jgi:hypothetical protein
VTPKKNFFDRIAVHLFESQQRCKNRRRRKAGRLGRASPDFTADDSIRRRKLKEQQRGVRSKSGKTLASNRFDDVDF